RSDAPTLPGLEVPRLAGDRVDETLAVDDADVPAVLTAEVNGQALLVHGRAGASRLVAAACQIPGVQGRLLGAGTEAGDDVDTTAGDVHDVLDLAPEAGFKTQVAPLVHQGVAELLEQGQCSASVLRVRGDHVLGVNPRPLTHDGAGPVRDEPATDLLVRDDATLRHQRHRAAAASGALGLSAIAHEIDVPDLADLEVDPDRVGDRVDGTNEDVDDVDDAVDSTLDDAQHLVPDRLGLVLDLVPDVNDLILQLQELRDELLNNEVDERIPDMVPDPVPHIGDLVADILPDALDLLPQGLEPWQQGVSDEAPNRIPDRLDDDVPRP